MKALDERMPGVVKAVLFTNGTSQAVRIPKMLAYENADEVLMLREGDTITIQPKRKRNDLLSVLEELHARGPIPDGEAWEITDDDLAADDETVGFR